MPRYAKGSLEEAIYRDLVETATEETPARSYVDPDNGEKVYAVEATRSPVRQMERTIALSVCQFGRLWEMGLISTSNFLLIVRDLVKE